MWHVSLLLDAARLDYSENVDTSQKSLFHISLLKKECCNSWKPAFWNVVTGLVSILLKQWTHQYSYGLLRVQSCFKGTIKGFSDVTDEKANQNLSCSQTLITDFPRMWIIWTVLRETGPSAMPCGRVCVAQILDNHHSPDFAHSSVLTWNTFDSKPGMGLGFQLNFLNPVLIRQYTFTLIPVSAHLLGWNRET